MVYQTIVKPNYEFLKVTNSTHNFPMHFHKRLCIGKVVAGEKYIQIGNQVNKIEKNGIYIIQPYNAHSCKIDKSCDYLVFTINSEEINNLETFSEGISFLEIDLHKARKLVRNICESISFENDIVNYLIKYCEKNYNDNIKINDLAIKLGYNKYYILHLFKEKMGISIHQYIIQLRVKMAKKKNRKNDMLEIALENGFFDQSHLIRHFKKYEGITPKEYYKSKMM